MTFPCCCFFHSWLLTEPRHKHKNASIGHHMSIKKQNIVLIRSAPRLCQVFIFFSLGVVFSFVNIFYFLTCLFLPPAGKKNFSYF